MFFFYLTSANIAKERVALRVSKGGHNIPPDVIERRYALGIKNLFEFIKIVDQWFVYNNVTYAPQVIAEGEFEKPLVIYNFEVWEKLKAI